MLRRLLFGCVLIGAGAGVVSAKGESRDVEHRAPLVAGGAVKIENISGSVKVIGWSQSEVAVKARLDWNVERLDFDDKDGSIRIQVILPKRTDGGGNADLTVHVPFGSRLEVETVSANITATDLQGEAELQSVSGEIAVSGALREAELETVSGAIELVSSAPLEQGKLNSVSGELLFAGNLAGGARLRMNTVSGRIEARIPSHASAEIQASTFSGSIKSDLTARDSEEGFAGGGEKTFVLGDGSARVKLNSFSGSVRIDTGVR